MGLVGLTNVLAIEGGALQHQGQRDLADRRHPHDRGSARQRSQDLLDPAFVSPVVAYLAHEDCPVSGNIYSVGGGRVVRFFIGMTEGYLDKDA